MLTMADPDTDIRNANAAANVAILQLQNRHRNDILDLQHGERTHANRLDDQARTIDELARRLKALEGHVALNYSRE